MKNPRATSNVCHQISQQVYSHASKGRLVLTLGGDHSIAIGTVSGTARAIKERLGKEVAVIWVDAHADINTPEMSESGNIHGMPVSFLTGLATGDGHELFGWVNDEWNAVQGSGKANGTNGKGHNGTSSPKGITSAPLSINKLVYIGLRDVDRGEKKILREHGIKSFSMHDIDRCVSRSSLDQSGEHGELTV